jgi:ATP-binding cassette subfamily B protein
MQPAIGPSDRELQRHADRLLGGAASAGAAWYGLLIVDTVAGVAMALARPALLATAVDAATHQRGGRAVVALAVLGAGMLAAAVVAQIAEVHGVARGTVWLRRAVIRHALALAPSEGRFTAGDLTSRVNAATPQAAGLTPHVVDMAAGLSLSVGAVIALWCIDWRIVAVLGLATPFVVVIVAVLMRQTSVSVVAYQQGQGEMAGRFVDALRGARTIRASDTVDEEIERVTAPLPAIAAAGHALWRTYGVSAGRAGLITPLISFTALSIAGSALASGSITPGEMLAAAGYIPMALGAFDHMSTLGTVAVSRASGRRLAEVVSQPAPRPGWRALPPGPGCLELRQVCVSLGSTPVLDHVDLVVEGGTTMAVVGRVGAGKSTLAQVAGRLLDPDAGVVTLDGIPVSDIDREDLRNAVAYAFETPHLTGTTVGDAIAYGAGPLPPATLEHALSVAQAAPFIERLPGGLDAPLASAPFSGGERQRLGLARAFARRPRLLILDDATSSLDTLTEARVQAALTAAGAGLTCLVTAHRVSTAARADLVAWIDDGRVRRVAPHAEQWSDPEYRAAFGGDAPAPLAPAGRGAS